MRRLVLACLAAVTFGAATAPRPAFAYRYYGGGFALGSVVGLGVGAALARPFYPYPYYPYYYPPVVYAPYAYPPAVVVAPPVAYAAPPAQPAPPPARTPECGPKRYYNTLTGHCDQ